MTPTKLWNHWRVIVVEEGEPVHITYHKTRKLAEKRFNKTGGVIFPEIWRGIGGGDLVIARLWSEKAVFLCKPVNGA